VIDPLPHPAATAASTNTRLIHIVHKILTIRKNFGMTFYTHRIKIAFTELTIGP